MACGRNPFQNYRTVELVSMFRSSVVEEVKRGKFENVLLRPENNPDALQEEILTRFECLEAVGK